MRYFTLKISKNLFLVIDREVNVLATNIAKRLKESKQNFTNEIRFACDGGVIAFSDYPFESDKHPQLRNKKGSMITCVATDSGIEYSVVRRGSLEVLQTLQKV